MNYNTHNSIADLQRRVHELENKLNALHVIIADHQKFIAWQQGVNEKQIEINITLLQYARNHQSGKVNR